MFDFPGVDVEPLQRGDRNRDRDAPGRNGSEAGNSDFLLHSSVTGQRVSAACRESKPALPSCSTGSGQRAGWVEDGWGLASPLGDHITEGNGGFSGLPWQDEGFPGTALTGLGAGCLD